MKTYKIVRGCQIEGKPYKVGEKVKLDDRIAAKLKALSTPRIEEIKVEKKLLKTATKPANVEENRAVGLPDPVLETR